jgi:hypothetical protein
MTFRRAPQSPLLSADLRTFRRPGRVLDAAHHHPVIGALPSYNKFNGFNTGCQPHTHTFLSLARPLPSRPCCYNKCMTLVEVRYRLQSALTPVQLSTLAEFSNTYGLRRFRVDETGSILTFEYDASRLRETQVAHVLRQAQIPVLEKVA